MKELVMLKEAMKQARIKPDSKDGKQFFFLFLKNLLTQREVQNLYDNLFPSQKTDKKKQDFPIKKWSAKVDAWIQEANKVCNPTLRTMPYADFLETQYWKYVRNAKLEECNDRCENCRAKSGLQIHHLHYTHRGQDHRHLSFLMVLCGPCHKKRHHIKS